MKALFINTSTKTMIVSIIIDNEIKYLYKNKDFKDLAFELMVVIDEALQKVNLKMSDIDTIFVTNGPGSFTGIRIGLTVAKTMAYSCKIRVVPISSLELIASTETDKEYIIPLIDARRDYVYAGVYDKQLNSLFNDSYILLDVLKQRFSEEDVFFVSDDIFDMEINESDYDILKIINKHQFDSGVNPHQLKPNYLKITEAEENLMKRGN